MAEPLARGASIRDAVAWTLLAFCAALPVSIAAINIFAAALTVLLLVSDRFGERLPWNRALNAFTCALLVYFAAAALTCGTGIDPAQSLRQLNKDFHKLWMAWLLLTATAYVSPRRFPWLLGGGIFAMALVGIVQSLLLRQPGGFWVRAHAFVHPVTFGEQLAICLLGALCLLARGAEAAALDITRRRLLGFTAVIGTAFLLNQTRGALAGAAAGVGVVLLLDRTARRWALPMAAGGIVVLLCWETLLPTGRSIALSLREQGLNSANHQLQRLVFWDVAWNIFKDNPWLGVGPGHYKTVYHNYFSGVIEHQRSWGSAHNLYIHQLAERGLVGAAALAAVLVTALVRAWRRVREEATWLNLWALSATCAFLVMNLTEVAFQNEQVTSLMIFVWAVAETSHRRNPAGD